MLSNLPHILICLQIQECDLNAIMDATVWLLAKRQQDTLSAICIEFFVNLAKLDATAVYVKILKYASDELFRVNAKKILNKIL